MTPFYFFCETYGNKDVRNVMNGELVRIEEVGAQDLIHHNPDPLGMMVSFIYATFKSVQSL